MNELTMLAKTDLMSYVHVSVQDVPGAVREFSMKLFRPIRDSEVFSYCAEAITRELNEVDQLLIPDHGEFEFIFRFSKPSDTSVGTANGRPGRIGRVKCRKFDGVHREWVNMMDDIDFSELDARLSVQG